MFVLQPHDLAGFRKRGTIGPCCTLARVRPESRPPPYAHYSRAAAINSTKENALMQFSYAIYIDSAALAQQPRREQAIAADSSAISVLQTHSNTSRSAVSC